ncbi:MAG: hypothetical protein DMG15_16175 [Acidobacteria bacterium]|nr:MAG: hypothetical protein DMG15_16175 [Acidobacteriota bacterium]
MRSAGRGGMKKTDAANVGAIIMNSDLVKIARPMQIPAAIKCQTPRVFSPFTKKKKFSNKNKDAIGCAKSSLL